MENRTLVHRCWLFFLERGPFFEFLSWCRAVNYSPRVSLSSLWAHETYVGVQSALLWKSRPQWCENVLQCIQKKTRMGSLPFTIHNISHHNKKRSPRSFEKRSEGKYLCTPSYRGLLVTAVLLFGRSTAVSQSIWLKKKKGLSSRKLIHTKYVEYTYQGGGCTCDGNM